MISNACARDVMETSVISIDELSSLKVAWDTFSNNQIGGAPVLNESNEVIGVISQSDILRCVMYNDWSTSPNNNYYIGAPYWEDSFSEEVLEKLNNVLVREVMSSDVVSASEDTEISTISVLMRQNHVHRIIITEDKQLRGIITSLGLLKILEQH